MFRWLDQCAMCGHLRFWHGPACHRCPKHVREGQWFQGCDHFWPRKVVNDR